MRPQLGRLLTLVLLGSALSTGVAYAANSGVENAATPLKSTITQALASVQSKIDSSADPTKLNCLNTEKANLETYLTDAKGIEGGIQAAIDGENLDAVEDKGKQVEALQSNVDSAIERANGCKGATDLSDGTTMSITVQGGDTSDEGDGNFGASPSGTTRTDEASGDN